MQTCSNKPRPATAISEVQGHKTFAFRGSVSPDEVSAFPRPKKHAIELQGTAILAVAVYALAFGGSALLNLNASVLDAVPVYFALAALLHLSSRLIFPHATRMARGIEAAFFVLVLGLSLACLSYLGASARLPLRDAEMIWIDRHLGFDWLRIMTALDNWPRLLNLLDGAYATFTFQLIATVFVLVVANRTRELDRFFITFVCASVIAEIASVLVPTLGPMSVLAGHANFTNLPMLGRATAEIVLALREGTLKTIDLDALNGIISFPSLHAAVAVMVPYALRWNKPLFWPVLVLDGVMLLSAVPSGNHYLADVLGGLAVAAVAIVCGRYLQDALGVASVPKLAQDPQAPSAYPGAAQHIDDAVNRAFF
ncbi:MAG TPA: phosphatase PAP2 family protein [Xanthobacteraceae bacterium]|jgi:membrane-associated phospholipid phosphatase